MIVQISARQGPPEWREHTRIVRGNPMRIYEGEKFELMKTQCFQGFAGFKH